MPRPGIDVEEREQHEVDGLDGDAPERADHRQDARAAGATTAISVMIRCAVGGWSSSPSVVAFVRHRISFVAAWRDGWAPHGRGIITPWGAIVDAAADCGAGEGCHRRCRHRRARRRAPSRPALRRRALRSRAAARGATPTQYSPTVMRSIRGFVVCNERNYPEFLELMRELGVALRPSTMSFSVRCERCDLEFSGHGLRRAVRAAAQPRAARRSPGCCSISAASSATRARVLDDPAGERADDRRVPRARRLRPRADRSLPRADGRGDLVVVAGAHARDAGALLPPLLRQPRAARRARRAAVVHDRGRLADATSTRSARACAAASRSARPCAACAAAMTASRSRRATARPSASTASSWPAIPTRRSRCWRIRATTSATRSGACRTRATRRSSTAATRLLPRRVAARAAWNVALDDCRAARPAGQRHVLAQPPARLRGPDRSTASR